MPFRASAPYSAQEVRFLPQIWTALSFQYIRDVTRNAMGLFLSTQRIIRATSSMLECS
jgi:hypothetical protein